MWLIDMIRRLICPDYGRRDGNWQADKSEVMDYSYRHNYMDSIEHAYKEGDDNTPSSKGTSS